MGKSILGSMAILTETFRRIDISDDDIMTVASQIGFVHIFDDIPDSRMEGKTKYRLRDILFLVFIVKLRERTNSCMEIAAHIKINRSSYEGLGLINDGMCPSHDTIRRVMMLVDGDTLYAETVQRFYEFLLSLEAEFRSRGTVRHIALDGKTVRGSGRAGDAKTPLSQQHILNVYDCSLATCIKSEPIDSKTNEIPVAQALLKSMDLKRTVVTADAMHCQRETASIIHGKKGLYVLVAKENQPLLLEEIRARFDRCAGKASHHSREKREIDILPLPRGYASDGFSGLKAFVRMVSSAGKRKTERFFITNTTDQELICEAIEGRWAIENGLHKEKDVFLYEDRIRHTNRNAVRNMVIMNNLAMQIVRIYQALIEPNLYMAKLTVHDLPMESIKQILAVMGSDEIIEKVKADLRAKKKKRG